MIRSRTILPIVVVLLVAASMASAQTIITVPGDFATIQGAVDSVPDATGHQILVAPGVYAPFSINGKQNIDVFGAGTAATFVDGTATSFSGVGMDGSSDISIQDMTVQNANKQTLFCFNCDDISFSNLRAIGQGFSTISANGVIYGFGILNSTNVTVTSVLAEDCSGGGFQVTGGSDADLVDVSIFDCGGGPQAGVAAIVLDTEPGVSIPGGDIVVDISGSTTISGSPVAFQLTDVGPGVGLPTQDISATLTGMVTLFGVNAVAGRLGEGTVTGLGALLDALGATHQVTCFEPFLANAAFWTDSLTLALLAVPLTSDPASAIITALSITAGVITETGLVVGPGMSVAAAVAKVAIGGTVTLLPGTYPVDTLLFLKDGVTLKGATGNRADVCLDAGLAAYILRVENCVGVTIRDLSMKNADFEFIKTLNADDLTVQNVAMTGNGLNVQSVGNGLGRIHGIVTSDDSTNFLFDDLDIRDLSGAAIECTGGSTGTLSNLTSVDTGGNLGFGCVHLTSGPGGVTPGGAIDVTLAGTIDIDATSIANGTTVLPSTGIFILDSPGLPVTLTNNGATAGFLNITTPLLTLGLVCDFTLDATAFSLGLPIKVTDGEPLLPPTTIGYYIDMASANFALMFSSNGGANAVFDVLAARPFPGTDEDIKFESQINFAGNPNDPFKTAGTGDFLTFKVTSPCGTLNALPPFIIASAYMTGSTPPGEIFPGIWVDTNNVAVVFDPFANGIGFVVISPIGLTLTLQVPMPNLLAGMTTRIQSFTPDANAANLIFESSDAHEIEFIN